MTGYSTLYCITQYYTPLYPETRPPYNVISKTSLCLCRGGAGFGEHGLARSERSRGSVGQSLCCVVEGGDEVIGHIVINGCECCWGGRRRERGLGRVLGRAGLPWGLRIVWGLLEAMAI